jgi:putative zinc finger/helix-turn-helix YgiT family protein
METCYHCGAALQAIKDEPYHYTACGLDDVFIYGVTKYRCTECEEVFIEIPRVNQLHRVIGRMVCQKEGKLSGEEIRFLRKEMRKKGTDFARMLGVSPEYVSRLENNKTDVSETLGRLIRSLFTIYTNEGYAIGKGTFEGIIQPHTERVPKEIKLTPSDWLMDQRCECEAV